MGGSVSLVDGHIDEPRMTDNEIIKALEGNILNAKSVDCKVWSIELYKLENALNLINRLNKTTKYQAEQIIDLKIKVKEQRAEIERLEAEVQKQKEQTNDVIRSYVENEWN